MREKWFRIVGVVFKISTIFVSGQNLKDLEIEKYQGEITPGWLFKY